MEVILPPWLCSDFLHHCLHFEVDKQDIVITSFTAAQGAPPGSNFANSIIRVTVEYRDKKPDSELRYLSLIVKSELTEGFIREMFNVIEYSEPIFYNKFIPEASKITDTSFAPKSFFSPKFSAVVLEDLKEQRFEMADRTKQLDFEHCRLYAVAAASLHAVSCVIHKQNPELVESIGAEKMFSSDLHSAETFKIMIRCGMKCLIRATERIDRYRKYCRIMEDISADLWGMTVDAHRRSEVMNTINQGDPWTSNMMFRYDDSGTVCQVKLVDFQALRYGSPVNDIFFFLWTSADHEVRGRRVHGLYQIYLDTLNSKLREFNCSERLSFNQFMDNVERLSPMALFIVGMVLPFLYDPAPVNFGVFLEVDLEDDAQNPYNKYYSNNFCDDHLPQLLEHLESSGVFRYLEKYKKK